MKNLDPDVAELAELSGMCINQDGTVSFDKHPVDAIANFYSIVSRHERMRFGQVLAKVIDRESKSY